MAENAVIKFALASKLQHAAKLMQCYIAHQTRSQLRSMIVAFPIQLVTDH